MSSCRACAELHRCACECGCAAHSHYRRCDPCGRGEHAGPPTEPVMPVAIRAALAFGEFSDKPLRLRAILERHLANRKAAER